VHEEDFDELRGGVEGKEGKSVDARSPAATSTARHKKPMENPASTPLTPRPAQAASAASPQNAPMDAARTP
jgi:hypothetical protein